jgi:hypothetical protein
VKSAFPHKIYDGIAIGCEQDSDAFPHEIYDGIVVGCQQISPAFPLGGGIACCCGSKLGRCKPGLQETTSCPMDVVRAGHICCENGPALLWEMDRAAQNSGICVMICNIKVIPLSTYARLAKKAQCIDL